MQAKTNALATTAGNIDLKINIKKTRHLKMSGRNNESITVNGEVVDEVDHFTYLGSMVSTSGDGEEEILVRISKAIQAFASFRGTWRSKNISQKTKIRFFKSNVLSTLLYGAESWKMTKTISHKLEVFQSKCLRRTFPIYWPQTNSNYELRRRTGTEPIKQQVRRKRWKCIGHVLRMPPAALPRVALRWTPDGRRKRGRPKETWRRTVEKEMKENSWNDEHPTEANGVLWPRPYVFQNTKRIKVSKSVIAAEVPKYHINIMQTRHLLTNLPLDSTCPAVTHRPIG